MDRGVHPSEPAPLQHLTAQSVMLAYAPERVGVRKPAGQLAEPMYTPGSTRKLQ